MRFLAWSLVSGFLVGAIVTWWPSAWQYAPGVVFGAAIAISFSKEVWDAHDSKTIAVLKLIGFVEWSYLAYAIALIEAEWILGTNGFMTFSSYNTPTATSALFVACFVGGCIGAFILALGMRTVFFKFDVVRGLFLFSLFSGALGSIIAAGFEIFGFIPQFLFPAWHLGVACVVLYMRRIGGDESVYENSKPVIA